jgi:hypothetical protein
LNGQGKRRRFARLVENQSIDFVGARAATAAAHGVSTSHFGVSTASRGVARRGGDVAFQSVSPGVP